MMHRRTFVTGLGAVLAAPRAVKGQPPGKEYRVGGPAEVNYGPISGSDLQIRSKIRIAYRTLAR
jgi:hypothetical protein